MWIISQFLEKVKYQPLARTNYIICRAQYKRKIRDSFFKYYEEFQDGDSRALPQAQGLSKHVAQCDRIGQPHTWHR